VSTPSEDTETYNPVTGTWATSNLNFGRARNGARLLKDGTVLTTGFRSFRLGPPVFSRLNDDSEYFDPVSNTWKLSAGKVAFISRFNYHYTVLPSGKALIAGGALRAAGHFPEHPVGRGLRPRHRDMVVRGRDDD